MYNYKGKVVIITGASRSLGLGIAQAFAKSGASLTITARNEEEIKAVGKSLEDEFGVPVLAVAADGASQEAVNNVVEQTVKKYGRIDVLINNAQAMVPNVKLEDQTKEIFDLSYHSGVYATMYYMVASFPYLKESKGSIINFGSGAGIVGMNDFAAYASNKEAIRGLSRVAAREWTQYGINTNVILPAVMTKGFDEWGKANPEAYEAMMATTPARTLADAETHVGGTCLFLASDDAKMISGNSFGVDGGQNLRP